MNYLAEESNSLSSLYCFHTINAKICVQKMIHFGTIHSWSRTSFLDQHCSANVGLLIDKLKDASLTISLLLLLLDK